MTGQDSLIREWVGWWRTRLIGAFLRRASWADLGLIRIVLYGSVLLFSFVWQSDFPLWADVPHEFWQPTTFFAQLNIQALDHNGLQMVLWLWRGVLLLSAVGVGGMPVRFVAFALSFYVFGLPHNYRKVHHSDGVIVIVMLIFAVARSDVALSFRALRQSTRGEAIPRRDADAYWPIALSGLLLTLVLWSAAVSKIRNSGVAWFSTDSLLNTVAMHHYYWEPPLNALPLLSAFPFVGRLAAFWTLLVEFAAPLTLLLSVRARLVLLAGMLAMMTSFWLLLGVLFLHYNLLLLCVFLPWRTLWAGVLRWQTLPKFVVLFDGSCGICTTTMRVLRRLDVFHRVEIRDVVGEWTEVTMRYPQLSLEECLKDMHVIRKRNGCVYRGFNAYRAVATAVPLAWFTLPLMWLPISSHIGRRIYRYVADHRHERGCELPVQQVNQS